MDRRRFLLTSLAGMCAALLVGKAPPPAEGSLGLRLSPQGVS
jgi:hypothetical protein